MHTASVPGYEADDVLAGAAAQAAAAGYAVRIYSSDQDLWQVQLLLLPMSFYNSQMLASAAVGQARVNVMTQA